MTKIPVNVRSDKKVCVIEDRVYILGLDDSTKLTDVAEYNARLTFGELFREVFSLL